MENSSEENAQQIKVNIPEELRPGRYANASNTQVTGSEVILDFMMINPGDDPQGVLVSRVILSRKHAQDFALSLRQAVDTANEVNPE